MRVRVKVLMRVSKGEHEDDDGDVGAGACDLSADSLVTANQNACSGRGPITSRTRRYPAVQRGEQTYDGGFLRVRYCCAVKAWLRTNQIVH